MCWYFLKVGRGIRPDLVPSHRAVRFKDPCTHFCLSQHLWCLILSKFLSVLIKPSTNKFQGHFSHYLQARGMCLQAASFLLGADWRQQGVLESSKGPSGGLGMANRLPTVIGLQYLLAPLCRGWEPRQLSSWVSLYAGQGWSPIRKAASRML